MERRSVRHKGLEHFIDVEEARSPQGHRMDGWYLCRVYAPEGQRVFIPKSYGHPVFLWEATSAEAAVNQIEDEIHADALEMYEQTKLYQS